MILDLISQTLLDTVYSNPEDSLPNKIKEKEDSLENTLKRRFNIPVQFADNQKNSDNSNEEDYEATTSYEPVVAEASIEKNVTVEENENNHAYELMVMNSNILLEGSEKPINVKENMIANMRRKGNELIRNEEVEINSITPEVYEMPEVTSEVEYNINKEVEEESKYGQYGIPENIEKILSSAVDFDTTVVAINQTREKVMDVSEKANLAAQAANESDKLLEEVSNKYSAAEKELQEKEKRSREMEKRIITLLQDERTRLSRELQEKENLINDANKRKEQNDGKIVDFRSKINSTLERTNKVDEKISRQEELLNTLVGFSTNNINDYDYKSIEEEISNHKVA